MTRLRFALLLVRAYIIRLFGGLHDPQIFSPTATPLRVVVFPQKNRVGDIICATPVFRAIKLKYPESHLVVVVSKSKGAWEILSNHAYIDELFFYEDTEILEKLKRGNFSVGINLTNYPIPSALMYVARIPLRAKTVLPELSRSERLTDWMNTHKFKYKHHTRLSKHYLSMLSIIGISDAADVKEVTVLEDCEKDVSEFLKKHDAENSKLLIGISVTAGNKVKEWGEEKFAKLADALIERHDATVILPGSKNDASKIQTTLSLMRHKDKTIPAYFPLRCVSALMRQFNLFVAVDTGPIYIAHALGVPLVDIVGPCDSNEQPPSDAKSICVLPKGLPPSSFVFKKPGSHEERRKAVEAISVEDVLVACNKLL